MLKFFFLSAYPAWGFTCFHILLQIHYCFLCLKLYRNIVKYQSLRQVAAYRNLKTVSVTCVQLSLVHVYLIDLSFEALAIRGECACACAGAGARDDRMWLSECEIERVILIFSHFHDVCVYKNQRVAAAAASPRFTHQHVLFSESKKQSAETTTEQLNRNA